VNKNGKVLGKPKVTSGKTSIRNSKSFRSMHSWVCYLPYTQQAKLLRVVSKTKSVTSWLL